MKNYLKGWFTPDFISALPIAEIVQFGLHDKHIGHALQWLHLLRVGRLLRTFSMESIRKMSQTQAFGLLTLTLLVFSHWLGSIFHEMTAFEHHDNWLYEHHIEHDSDLVKYVYSLYYAMTTVTTVGFGDVHGTNALERGYAIITTFIGANLYALILALLSLVISQLFAKGESIRQFDHKCTDSTTTLKLGYECEIKILLHNETHREAMATYSIDFLLNLDIPSSMKHLIVSKVLKPIIIPDSKRLANRKKPCRTPFLYCNDSLMLFIAKNLSVQVCAANETLYDYQELEVDRIYIIVAGLVRLYNENESEIARMKKGNYFGDLHYFYPVEKHKNTLQTNKEQENNSDGDHDDFDMKSVYHKTIKPFSDTVFYTLSFEKFSMIKKFDEVVFNLFKKIASKRAKQFSSYNDHALVDRTCSRMEKKDPQLMQCQYIEDKSTPNASKQNLKQDQDQVQAEKYREL